MTRRPCCLERRTRGAPNFTETARLPVVRLPGVDPLYGPLNGEQIDALFDTPSDGVSADQLDALPAGSLEAALARMAGAGAAEDGAADRLPVPRRPWRRVLCWLALGHFWFPDVRECLECGTARRRAPWRGDR